MRNTESGRSRVRTREEGSKLFGGVLLKKFEECRKGEKVEVLTRTAGKCQAQNLTLFQFQLDRYQ